MKTPRTFIVISTADYRIERVGPQDFDCFVAGAGYIGSEKSQQAAQRRIDDYRYNTMTRAPEALTLVCETCDGEGRIPADGSGDQAGGYADTCPDCEGKGHTPIELAAA